MAGQLLLYLRGQLLLYLRGGAEHSCIEVIFLIRMCLEKSLERHKPLIIISCDLVKAFDSLSLLAVIMFTNELEIPLPIRLRYAFIKEFLIERLLDFTFDGHTTEPVRMEKGIRQGACDSSLLFALIISNILFKLEVSWKARGFGVCFGQFAGSQMSFAEFFDFHFGHFLDLDVQNLHLCAIAFIDDLYLLCSDPRQAQIMLDELVQALS